MLQKEHSLVRLVFLGMTGFILGLFGVSVWAGRSPSSVLESMLSRPANPLAFDQCLAEPQEKESQIFFLSCGGIY